MQLLVLIRATKLNNYKKCFFLITYWMRKAIDEWEKFFLHLPKNYILALTFSFCFVSVGSRVYASPPPLPPPCCVKNFHPMKQEWETVGHPVHGWSNFWNIFFRIITFPTFGGSTNNEHVEDKLFINSYMWPHEKVCEHFVATKVFFNRELERDLSQRNPCLLKTGFVRKASDLNGQVFRSRHFNGKWE